MSRTKRVRKTKSETNELQSKGRVEEGKELVACPLKARAKSQTIPWLQGEIFSDKNNPTVMPLETTGGEGIFLAISNHFATKSKVHQLTRLL
ncbi:MAG: hypothetical protein HYW01_00840 [Deltaproteobacteria bacterium]|nr:hypothetical protein [Deltaproteobacteria bacterium]